MGMFFSYESGVSIRIMDVVRPSQILVFLMIRCTEFAAVHDEKSCTYIAYRGKKDSYNEEKCSPHSFCRKKLKISHIDFPPYSTSEIFEKILKNCCGNCSNIQPIRKYRNISEVKLSKANASDFILPFLGKSSAVNLYGFHFVPFIDAPSAYYITPSHMSATARVIKKCLSFYLLIVICILAAIISGFIVWCLEAVYGRKQLRWSPFLEGIFEGFWWSFTTITSGYGAKIVHSFPAKFYSVIWIFVGMLMFTLMTSLFTAELLNATVPHQDSMSGEKVGVLKYRDYDASLVVREEGIIEESQGWNFYSDVLSLMRMLREKTITGFIIDKYTLTYTKEYIAWKKDHVDWLITGNTSDGEEYSEWKADIEFFQKRTHYTMKTYSDKMSYGVLVRNADDYEFINNAVRDNLLSLETSVESEMNKLFVNHRALDTSRDSRGTMNFGYALKWTGGLLAVIFVFGLLYELYRYGKHPPSSDRSSVSNESMFGNSNV